MDRALAWSEDRPRAGSATPLTEGTWQALRHLACLRTFAPLAQLATVLVVTELHGVPVPMTPIAALLAIEVLLAAATWMRVLNVSRVSVPELFLQAQLDIVLFAALLYCTGGASNPFATLFLVPMAIAAPALPLRWVWVTALTTSVAYVLLMGHHVPLQHPRGDAAMRELYRDGTAVNYVLTAALLAFFVNRMHTALRRRTRMLAEAHDAQMRSESVTSIGALAARYAHELSSPLSTMAVVVTELMREHRGNRELQRDLLTIGDQIQASKQIVSSLAEAGGRRRAETAGGARLDEFVHGIICRARSLHPEGTIVAALDRITAPPRIVAEETLRQAVTSLIDHAVHASPEHVEVMVDWSGPDLLVVVRDRGPGFAADVLQRLGKQIGPTPGDEGGWGLGLLLSAVTLERLGGLLELTNEPSGGARASLRLPLSAITI